MEGVEFAPLGTMVRQLGEKSGDNRMNSISRLIAILAVLILADNKRAFAQGTTAFTYQGQLRDKGTPADGTYDLTFTLYTNSSGGTATAGPITNLATTVSNGLFITTIDFGAGAFTGTSNWLQIGVRTNGSDTFSLLTPLQEILPTPYAIYASNAGLASAAGIANSVAAANVSGTLGLAQLPGAVVTNNNAISVNLNGTFNGNLSGNAATATTATVATTAGTANNFSGSLAGDVTGTQNATVVSTVGGQTAASVASGAGAANGATSANTTNTIVQRDASGNFSAGTITANLAGNATTATTAANLAGNLADAQLSTNVPLLNGGNAFTGTNAFAGVTLATNAENIFYGTFNGNLTGNAPTATTATVATTAGTANNFSGSLAGDVTGTQNATVVSTVGGQTAASVASGAGAANAATSANTTNTIVQRDASGNFSAGTITANLAGNATTATTAANLAGNLADAQLSTNVPLLNGGNAFTGTNAFAGVTLATNAENIFYGTFNGNLAGNATTATTAANLAGNLADAQLSTNVPLLNGGNAFTGTNAFAGVTLATNAENIFYGTFNGNLTGNAPTATTATVATTAGTANNFCGSLAGDVTGTQNATVVSTVGGQTAASVASGAGAANGATSANTTNTIVQRDASGNFSAGTITANLAGNATTATTAANLAGNLADAQLSTNVPLLNGGNAFTGTNAFAGVTLATNAENIFYGTFNGNLTGNAATVSDGVYNTSSYSDPAWLTSLSGNKIIGTLPAAALPAALSNLVSQVAQALNGLLFTNLQSGNMVTTTKWITNNYNVTLADSVLFAWGTNEFITNDLTTVGKMITVIVKNVNGSAILTNTTGAIFTVPGLGTNSIPSGVQLGAWNTPTNEWTGVYDGANW